MALGVVLLVSSSAWSSAAFRAPYYPVRLGPPPSEVASFVNNYSVVAGDINEDGTPDVAVSVLRWSPQGQPLPDSSYVAVLLGRGDGTLGAKTEYSTDHLPMGLLLRDFDDDGHLDLVSGTVLNFEGDSGKVAFRHGRGDGTFDAPEFLTAGISPEVLVAADVDGDGQPDMLAFNRDDSTFAIFRRSGDGWGATLYSKCQDGVVSAAVGDLDGDGRVDVAMAHAGFDVVLVAYGRGDGTFTDPEAIAAGSPTSDVAVGDLDRDGRLDLVVVAQGLAILHNLGDRTFERSDVPTGGQGVRLADVTGDGWLDALALSGGLITIPNLGDGTLGCVPEGCLGSISDLGSAFALADMNGDGLLDAIVGGFHYPGPLAEVAVALGSGDGSFGFSTNSVLGSGAHALSTHDMDGDSYADLIVTSQANQTCQVFLSSPQGPTLAATLTTGTDPLGVETTDLDRDGRPDVIVANHGSGSVMVFHGQADHAFGAPAEFSTGAPPSAVAVGDLNGDDFDDVVVTLVEANQIAVLHGDGSGALGSPTLIASEAQTIGSAIVVADFNQDGIPDLAYPASASSVGIRLGQSGEAFATIRLLETGASPCAIAVADLDGDGDADLAVANNGESSISVFIGRGDGTFEARRDLVVGRNPADVDAADIDGDGHCDIVATNASSSDVSFLLGHGDGTFEPAIDFGIPGNPQSAALIDVDLDGRLDMAIASDGALTVLKNTSTPTTAVPPSPAAPVGTAHTYPNPAFSSVTWAADWPGTEAITLSAFDLRGRLIRRFTTHAVNDRLHHVWDLRDNQGSRVSPGVYWWSAVASRHRVNGRVCVAR